ncbi:dihydrofolate reductase [Methylocaldum szegediense]|nr:dihydrofolate reductase [Methylocaldum szegediense]
MKISLIVAMSENRVIGVDNRMPWHLSSDLKRFKRITMGKPLIMGRRTHESIGRPLPGRKNIVLTTDRTYTAPGCVVAHSLEDALEEANADEVMVIGGSSLYEKLLPTADRLYLTLIHRAFTGDTFFPQIKWDEWTEIERLDVEDDPDSGLSYSFLILERKTDNRGEKRLPD